MQLTANGSASRRSNNTAPSARVPLAVARAQRRPRPYDYVVCSLIFSYVWRIQDIIPVLGTLQFPIISSVVALAMFAFGGYSRHALAHWRSPIIAVSLFILCWMFVSVPGSVYPGLSFRFIVNDHVKTVLMLLLIVSSIRDVDDAERLAMANLIGAAIYCIKILTSFDVGASGRLNMIIYYDANDLAMMVVCTVPVAVYFLRSSAKAWQRVFALLCLGAFVLAVVKAGSRGGFLAFLAVALFLLFGFRAIAARARFGSVLALGALLLTFGSAQFWSSMETILHPSEDYNTNQEAGRVQIWKRGLGYIAERPFAGVGANAFTVAEGTLSPLAARQELGQGVKWTAAHNSFVQIGAELGAPGVIAFIWLLVHLLRTSWRVSRAKDEESGRDSPKSRALGAALVGTLIGYVVAGFFLSQAYSAYLYATCGLVTGLALATGDVPTMRTGRPKRAPSTRRGRLQSLRTAR